jgi:secondary thiamine-phosphate synthase enzyme
MRTTTFTIRTGNTPTVHDLTDRCAEFLADAPAGEGRDGLLNVFVPHATAGIAIIETGAGSDEDLLSVLEDVLPRSHRWRHRHGASGHGRDHVLPAFIAPTATIPVQDGRLLLGTWQSICLVDTNIDNPERSVRLSFLPA